MCPRARPTSFRAFTSQGQGKSQPRTLSNVSRWDRSKNYSPLNLSTRSNLALQLLWQPTLFVVLVPLQWARVNSSVWAQLHCHHPSFQELTVSTNRERNTAPSERKLATDFGCCQPVGSKLLKAPLWGMRAQHCEGLSIEWFQWLQIEARACASQVTVHVTWVNVRRCVHVEPRAPPSPMCAEKK